MIARKRLKPLRQKWQSPLTITTEFKFFHVQMSFRSIANISAEKKKKKTFDQQNDFEHDYIFSSSKTAISERFQFNQILKCHSQLFLHPHCVNPFASPYVFLIFLSSVVYSHQQKWVSTDLSSPNVDPISSSK